MSIRLEKSDNWTKLSIFLVYGSCFGKAFSFVGIPVGALFVFSTRALANRMYIALTRRDLLSGVSWALLLSIMYGICEVVYGILSGNKAATAFKILAFNLCPLYLFLGIWAGTRRPELMRRFIRFSAWFSVIYTSIYFLVLHNVKIVVPGTDIELFSRPGSGSDVLLGLLCFEPKLYRFWLPIMVCSFLTIANQIRADWLAFGIALVIWGAVTRKLGRVFSITAVLFALLLVGFIADIRLPALPGRGGEISTRETLARAIAGVDPEMAQEYTKNGGSYAGTVQWRQTWWKAIREAVFENYRTLIFGLGYGYPLKELVPGDLKKSSITSPHNIFYFTLGYSGCIGVVLFYCLQASILSLLWRTYKETGQSFGFVSHIAMLVGAHFGNFLEAPQSAIPTYIITGWCIGPLFHKQYLLETSPRYESEPATMNTNPPLPVTSRRTRRALSRYHLAPSRRADR
jgi:hypothetical protein